MRACPYSPPKRNDSSASLEPWWTHLRQGERKRKSEVRFTRPPMAFDRDSEDLSEIYPVARSYLFASRVASCRARVRAARARKWNFSSAIKEIRSIYQSAINSRLVTRTFVTIISLGEKRKAKCFAIYMIIKRIGFPVTLTSY